MICSECQNQLMQFYHFKNNARVNNFSACNKNIYEVTTKLNMFLGDCDFSEDLVALRYRQCFTIIPASKRDIMENFQTWQPRVVLQDIEESHSLEEQELEEDKAGEVSDFTIDDVEHDEIIKEEYQQYTSEMVVQEIMLAEIADESREEVKEPIAKQVKATKEQRQWANETTKACYSVEKQEDGIVPIWSCSLCGKIYHSAQALRLHLLAKHLKDEHGGLFSDETKEWIKREDRERRVSIDIVSGKKYEWPCRICEFTTATSETFQRHLIENHVYEENSERSEKSSIEGIQRQTQLETGEKIFKCVKCEASFKSENILRQHLLDHSQKVTNMNFSSISSDGTRQRKSKTMKYDWTCKDCWFKVKLLSQFLLQYS